MPRYLSFAAMLAGLLAVVSAQPVEIYPVRSGSAAQSLNGNWQFKYIAGSDVGADASFSEPAFAGATAWKTSAVPGHWELQGFAEPRYGKLLAEGTGLYRRTFRVPAGWSGSRVFLHFDGVLYGFDAWVNGTKVGAWASAYNPVGFDITDALKPGADNVLAVRVSTRSHGWEFDTNDCWALSGIYRDVTLFAVPAAHFSDWTARTKLNPDGSVSLSVTAQLSAPAKITGRLLGPDGALAGQLNFAADESGSVTATLAIDHPQLWTAETPALYTVELALSSGQKLTEKIGLREVTVEGGVLKLNGAPIKLHGADHHDIWPVNGRVATEELMRRDLELMRAANINFIRTSHYPPHPRFLELCDELGFYVMDEVPFGFGDEHLTDPDYQPDLLVRARATVHRDHNRSSVIVWSVGNENPITPIQLAAGAEVKRLDPTRPICFPTIGSYFAKNYEKFPEFVDLYSPHYPVLATIHEFAAKLTRPVIFTEYAHALGLATDRIQAEWAAMQASPRIAGGAVWMFQDQGILRVSEQSAAEAPANPYVWPDAHHYYDSHNLDGMDGIVYSDRTPQTDYWQVRKVYSPVQIPERELPLPGGAAQLTLHVENRFDFRALTGRTLAWSVVHNGIAVQTGTVPLTAAAHQTEEVAIQINWPDSATWGFTWLEVQCLDESGTSFYERSIRLNPVIHQNALDELTKDRPLAEVKVEEGPESIRVTHPGFSLTLTRATGDITLRNAAGTVLATGFQPHAGRKFTEAEKLRAVKDSLWSGALLAAAEPPQVTVTREDGAAVLAIHGRYARPETAGQFLAGTCTVRVERDGTIGVEYDYAPEAGVTGQFLEAGLALLVPAEATEFRWVGAGPYDGYPGKDVLNEFGAYHLTRDDLRFQGNRRDVELAALTRPDGNGVLLIAGETADVAVARVAGGTTFSHNAVISGRGNKGVGPEQVVKAEPATRLNGRFTLVPVAADSPKQFANWFGPAMGAVKTFQPFVRSYDQ